MSLLNTMIINGLFNEFLDKFEEKHTERQRWDYYINKLSPFDGRSWYEFLEDLNGSDRTVDEDITADEAKTVISNSYDILNNFTLEG